MRVLAIANQKGGTGKSSTAAAIAQAAAAKGHKVLAIDLDPQANLTFILAADATKKGSYYLINGDLTAADVQHVDTNLDVIPASWDLSTITTSRGSARRLANALANLLEQLSAKLSAKLSAEELAKRSADFFAELPVHYDYIVIDTPPTAGELQYNALQAATDLIIPLQANILDLQGLYQIADTAEQFAESNPNLKHKYIVFCRHNERSTIAKQMRQTIEQQAADLGIDTSLPTIPEGVAIKEAQALQQSLFEYAPESKPGKAYMALFEQIEKTL